jgi:PAS domain S-box-containing protein
MRLDKMNRSEMSIFAAAGLVALLLWAAIAAGLHTARREVLARANTEGRNLARSLAEHISSSVRAIDIVLVHLQADWVDGAVPFAAHVAREEKELKRENVSQVFVADADGRIVYSSLPGMRDRSVSDRPFFKAHKAFGQSELHISAPTHYLDPDQWAIKFTRPIYDRRGHFAGVIGLSVPPPALEQIYNDIDLGGAASITLVRADGRIIARAHGLAKSARISLAGIAGLSPDSAREGGYRRKALSDGVERLYRYQKVPDYPLTVYVGQALSTVLAPYRAERTGYMAGGFLATALLLTVALLFSTRQRDRENAERTRTRLEAELRHSEEQFRLIAETIDEVVWSAELRGDLDLYVSPAYERIWGRPRRSLQEDPWSFADSLHPDDRERVMAELKDVRKTGKRLDREYRILLPDGSLRWIWDRGFPVRAETGEIVRYVGAAQDITGRVQALAALEKERRDYHAIIDAAPVMITYKDKDDRHVRVNAAFAESVGLPAEKIIGMRTSDVVRSEEAARLVRNLDLDVIRTGKPMLGKMLKSSGYRGGNEVWLLISKVPFYDAGGAIAGVVSFIEDIDDRVRAQEQTRRLNEDLERRVCERTAELSAANQALQGEVAERRRAEQAALNLADQLQNMARRLGEAQEIERRRLAAELHDGVCSNLAAIGLNLALLQRQLPHSGTAGWQRRLSDVIAQIDEAKDNAKDISVDLRPLLLEERGLLSALEDYARRFEGSTGIAVQVKGGNSARRLPPEQKIALFRIAQEALTNCAKHAQANAVAIELDNDTEHLLLSVTDDGVGIDLARINGKKTGLGLLSMQERAEAIGCRWRIESMPGKGTRVSVSTASPISL